jgi:hypothetical protein
MNLSLLFLRFRWLHLPAALLSLLLQRAPQIRALVATDYVLASPFGTLLKGGFLAAALGGFHARAGATQLSSNPSTPATARVGDPFTLVFAVTGAPATAASYEVRGALPPGLSIAGLSGDTLNSDSGILSGTPTTAGSYSLNIRAWNSPNKAGLGGNPTFTLQIQVQPSAVAPPVFSLQPTATTVLAGTNVTLTATATGGTVTYQWSKDGVNIPGATAATLTLNAVTAANAGSYRVTATNAGGSTQSGIAIVTVSEPIQPPTIVGQPLTQVVVGGRSVTLTVDVAGAGPFSYRWRKAGVDIPGATAATLTLPNVQAADAGGYSVVVTNAGGSSTSATATLGVIPAVASRISNVSVRTTLAANQLLIVGLTMTGGSKPVVIRAVGPGLAPFGVAGTMPDPRLALFRDTTQLEANDNWGGTSPLTTAFASVGAFGLPPASLDAALLSPVDGGRTAQVSGPTGGNVIVEAYDAGTGLSPRLTNISARNRAGTGGDILIAGFTIDGTSPKTVLIRAVGPTLGVFGVPGVLADPKLEVFAGQARVTENDTWSPSLASTFSAVGAFLLTPGSKDAALVLSLAPGGYTVQVSGADGGTGEALVEIYEVQP